jgi:methionyl-tRNA formyltransferase
MVNPTAPFRIVFFGTPEFAVPTLRALLASQHAVVGVVTQPDRQSGRGQRLHPSPVKEVADIHHLALLQPERLRHEPFLNTLRGLDADLGVVAAYGKILTDPVLEIPRFGVINLHASLLPKYRGAAPIHRAVMAGEVATGVTIMRVVKALDAGPMLSSVARAIGPEETSVDVEVDLARLGAQALVNAVGTLSAGTATETPQDESAATYAPKLKKEDGIIRWSDSAQAIHDQIRGLHPWPHAYSELDGMRSLLLESRVDPRPSEREPGTIVEAAGDTLRVQTGDGVLRIVRLQLEGRRAVSTREFLAGHHLGPGARFTVSRPEP